LDPCGGGDHGYPQGAPQTNCAKIESKSKNWVNLTKINHKFEGKWGLVAKVLFFCFQQPMIGAPKKGEPSTSNIEGPPEVFENLLQCSPLGKKGGSIDYICREVGDPGYPPSGLRPSPIRKGRFVCSGGRKLGGELDGRVT